MKISSPQDSSDKEMLKRIKDTIYRRLDPRKYQLFLFGSRASGKARKTSDYDIGIIGDHRVDFNTLMYIRSDLEDIPALIDIIDFQTVDASFKKVAFQNFTSLRD